MINNADVTRSMLMVTHLCGLAGTMSIPTVNYHFESEGDAQRFLAFIKMNTQMTYSDIKWKNIAGVKLEISYMRREYSPLTGRDEPVRKFLDIHS